MWWIDEPASQINGTTRQAFGSRHAGGAYFVFCDGSVRFFPENTNVATLRFLAGRSDGTPVDLPE